jgi:hypothetical protein
VGFGETDPASRHGVIRHHSGPFAGASFQSMPTLRAERWRFSLLETFSMACLLDKKMENDHHA